MSWDSAWRRRYARHLRSGYWATLKSVVRDIRGDRCERCGNPYVPLQLHHKTYQRLGNEEIADVALLCWPCHEKADFERKKRYRRRRRF
jgi:5-methylcytosine-specific restriction endonuclease McrA